MRTIDGMPARNPHGLWAVASAALLGYIAVLCLPVVDEPWGVRLWFLPMYLSGIVLLEGLIALFLALQLLAGSPTRALAWLSGAYAFTATTAVAQFLTFPDLLDEPLASGAAGHVTAWLWVLRHAGFPCFVLLAVSARSKTDEWPHMRIAAQRLIGLLPVAVGVIVAVAGAALLIRDPDLVPALAEGNDFSLVSHSFYGAALVALNVFALAAVIYKTRLRELIGVWLAFAMFAFTLDVVLSLAAMARYNAGWYVARGLSLASAAGLMVALLIEHFTLHRDAEVRAAFHEQEAMHDPLTGLFNRRHLMGRLAEELGRAKRYRYPVAALLLDVDHFKRINDRHGHAAGDECLRALAQALGERGHRQGDFTARYGGEEFVVVLAETGLDGAIDVAEEIRRRVEALYGRGVAPWPMTVSIGIATASLSKATSTEELLAEADVCLYRAKKQGRNRVVWPQDAADLSGVSLAPA